MLSRWFSSYSAWVFTSQWRALKAQKYIVRKDADELARLQKSGIISGVSVRDRDKKTNQAQG